MRFYESFFRSGMLRKGMVFVLLIGSPILTFAQTMYIDSTQPVRDKANMDWWREARFGMFIHWGVYAVPAGRYEGKLVKGFYEGHEVPSAGEWIMHDARISPAKYKAFARQFNPKNYNPEAWVRMAKEAGMKYIVITTKHHDGFALFETKASDWNVVQQTPYGKDLLTPLAAACRKYGMKLGLYYSQANDWINPGGAADGGHWDSTQNGSMDEYINKVAVPQVREILSHYGDIAVLWFDVPTDMTKERADLFLPLLKLQPGMIINNRLGGGVNGDIITPEQYIPPTGLPGKDWETCMTMNDTWGYKKDDHKWKSNKELIRNLIDIASKGGNYLLNVGPDATGAFPPASVERLQVIGRWMHTNGEAIYGTTANPLDSVEWGRCTKKIENNRMVLYLHVFDWPAGGELRVPLKEGVTGNNAGLPTARLLAGGVPLKMRKTSQGWIISLPMKAPDPIASVIKIEPAP